MSTKQLGILLALALVLGAAVKFWRSQNSAGWSGSGRSAGQELLGTFQVNDVAQVVISRGADKVTLVKTPDRWVVKERGDFAADFTGLKSLLLKLQGLKIVQSDDIGASQLARLQLAGPDAGANAATVLELRDAAGKPMKSLLLGKKHMQKAAAENPDGWPDGRYVMTDAAAGKVLLVADGLAEVEPAAANWVGKDFVKVDRAVALAATFPVATNSWSLTRTNETADWQLANATAAEKLDSSKLGDLASPLSNLSLADVQTSAAGMGQPVELTAKTADGFAYDFKVGTKTNDNYPVSFSLSAVLPATTNGLAAGVTLDSLKQKLAAESALTNWSYLVPAWTLDPVLKGRSEWLVTVTNEPATNAAAGK